MEKCKKVAIEGLDSILSYIGLCGYQLLEENDTFYLEKNGVKAPIQIFEETDGRVNEFYCDMNEQRIYFKKEKDSQSFGIKKDGQKITGISLTKSGEFNVFFNTSEKQCTLSLSDSDFAFSYDDSNLHIGSKIHLGGVRIKNVLRFLEVIAKANGQFIFASVEKTLRTNHLIFRGEISHSMEFEPFVTVKKRCKRSELPSHWIDAVLFPENAISYLEKTMEELEKMYPGLTNYLRQYHATFGNVFPENKESAKNSSLRMVWPYVMENVSKKLNDQPEEKSTFVPKLTPSK